MLKILYIGFQGIVSTRYSPYFYGIFKMSNMPTIDNFKCCYDSVRDIKIYDCILSDDGLTIDGYTEDGAKAKYISDKGKWFYGSEISRLNLITFADRTPQEMREITAKANQKRIENNEKKRTLNEIAKSLLTVELSERNINQILGDSKEIVGDSKDVGTIMIAKMIQSAMSGSFKCAEFVRDTAGYKPKNEMEISADIMTDDDRALLDKVSKRLIG